MGCGRAIQTRDGGKRLSWLGLLNAAVQLILDFPSDCGWCSGSCMFPLKRLETVDHQSVESIRECVTSSRDNKVWTLSRRQDKADYLSLYIARHFVDITHTLKSVTPTAKHKLARFSKLLTNF